MPNITALKQLKRVIENTPDDLLHMAAWGGDAACGTVRCAAGWAAVDPWFVKRGLHLRHGSNAPVFEDNWPDESLKTFFKLTYAQTEHLFAIHHPRGLPGHSVSARQVLNQIDRILDGKPTRHYRVNKP